MMVLHLSHHPLLYIHVTYIQPGTDYTQCSNESTVLFSSVLVSTCRDADLRPVLRFPVSVSAFLALFDRNGVKFRIPIMLCDERNDRQRGLWNSLEGRR